MFLHVNGYPRLDKHLVDSAKDCVSIVHRYPVDMNSRIDLHPEDQDSVVNYSSHLMYDWTQRGRRICLIDNKTIDFCLNIDGLLDITIDELAPCFPHINFMFNRPINNIYGGFLGCYEHMTHLLLYGSVNYPYAVFDKDFTLQNLIDALKSAPDALIVFFNYILLLNQFPQYRKTEKTRIQTKTESIPVKCTSFKILKSQVIKESGSGSGSGSGSSMPTHWRKGHWRRQFHGLTWKLSNPDVRTFTRDDKEYHLALIPPVLVNGACKGEIR